MFQDLSGPSPLVIGIVIVIVLHCHKDQASPPKMNLLFREEEELGRQLMDWTIRMESDILEYYIILSILTIQESIVHILTLFNFRKVTSSYFKTCMTLTNSGCLGAKRYQIQLRWQMML